MSMPVPNVPAPNGRPFHELDDVTLLACLVAGEARGEGDLGRIAVAWTARNRVNSERHRWFGVGWPGVILKRWQFSAFNIGDANREKLLDPVTHFGAAKWAECYRAAAAVYFGFTQDPTRGADHYFVKRSRRPSWAGPDESLKTCQIGAHAFYRLQTTPIQEV